MKTSPFVNIHCHKSGFGQVVSIENVFVQNRQTNSPNGFYSLGLHPWHILEIPIDFDLDDTLIHFIKIDKTLIAIGEIGLDHAIAIPIETQIKIFEQQLLVAQTFDLPVIIHCVRAYSELLHCKKRLGITIPMIIHDYYGNLQTTKELEKHGFYFSFGKQFSLKNDHAIQASKVLSLDKIFLETDESDFEIENVYSFLSKYRNIPMQIIQNQVYTNFLNCFSRK
jgi:TatD DNase family protein